jgi:flagellar basal body P-ring protein FlgI
VVQCAARFSANAMNTAQSTSDLFNHLPNSFLRSILLSVLLITVSGCASGLMGLTGMDALSTRFSDMMDDDKKKMAAREKEEDEEDNNDFETRVETPLLGDYISVTGNNLVALRGVGLVTGLDGTGGDPPPSHLRSELLREMARRKIPNASKILADPSTAMVIITAYLPAMVREGQKFDVRVALPPNSEATSLKGGWLLETRLAEEQAVAGQATLKGHQYGIAHGAILTALGDSDAIKNSKAMLRRGSIPGGATSRTDRDLEVNIRGEFRGLKTSKRIQNAISTRLSTYNRFGQRIPMAEAKTDTQVELMVHPLYRNNFPRYQQMIRSIAFRETEVARRMRLESLARDVLKPERAATASLRLEAIGKDAIPFLKAALASSEPEVRFHAAQALAYLEDGSGVDVLKQAVIDEPAFRVYGLAALSVVQDANAVIALRELLSDESLETRYGAVRALKENTPGDSALGTTEFPHQFVLHAIECSGPTAVHVVRYRAPEVVVFGANQELRLPTFLNVGNRISIMGEAGTSKVAITKYSLDAPPKRVESSTQLTEIIHAVASLGANYPDIVQMLLEAESQHNLAGELGIDRLPQAGRIFMRSPGTMGNKTKQAKLGTPALTPGLFDRVEESAVDTTEEDTSALSRMFENRDREEAEAGHSDDSLPAAEATPGISKTQDADSDAEAADFHGFGLSEDANASGNENSSESSDEFVVEKTEFSEPMGSKFKRIFLSPFQKQE